MIRFKNAFWLVLVTLFVSSGISQTDNVQVNVPPAPEAATFGKFGDIPVGEFTGSAQIGVPLYTISHRGVSIPLGLSYHTNGIRVSEEAGWTGLGWSLSTGGMITRAIRGHDDFGNERARYGCTGAPTLYTNYWTHAHAGGGPQGFSTYGDFLDVYSYLQFTPHRFEYYIHPDELNETGPVSYSRRELPYIFDGQEYPWNYFCQTSENVIDLESDLYSYNLLGYSGKFIIGNDGEIVFLEATDLKVEEPIVNSVDDVRWVFTTPQGIKVYVGTTRNARQMTYTRSRSSKEENGVSSPPDVFGLPCNTPAYSHISTWYVDRIEAPTGEVWTLDYELANQQLYHPVPSFSTTQKDKVAQDGNTSGPDTPNRVYNKTVTSIAYDNVYLNKISVPAIDEEVYFIINEEREDLDGGILLDKIIVERGGEQYKVFDFSYDYFQSPTTDLEERWEDDFYGSSDGYTRLTDSDGSPVIEFDLSGTVYYTFKEDYISKRLKLTAVQELGFDESANIPPFTFAYHENLPVKTSYAVDMWGHYNGAHDNRTYIATIIAGYEEAVLLNCDYQIINGGDDSADRRAHFPYTQAGLLHTVTYPTGGSSELTYEAHQYGVSGEVAGSSYADMVYRKDNDCEYVPAPSSIPFVFEDHHPNFDVRAVVNLEWKIIDCSDDCLGCLEIIDGTPNYDAATAFRYYITDVNGIEIGSWDWTEAGEWVVNLPNPGFPLYYGLNQIYLEGLVGGETYYLNIERINGGQLPPNLLEARMNLEWITFDATEYTLTGQETAGPLMATNTGYCTSVPLPQPIDFVVDDNNPVTNPCVNVELFWRIEDCSSDTFTGCNSTNCLDVDQGDDVYYDPLVSFRYVIDDANGNEVASWNWNNGSGGILGAPTGQDGFYNSRASFQLANLDEGEVYTMRIEGLGGTDLAFNLIQASMKLTWAQYAPKPLREGAGVRIASTVSKTEGGQEAQSRYYVYEDENGVPSGRAFDSPITHYVSTEGRINIRQITPGVSATESSSTAYLNRLSNSLNALSDSYAGNHVSYDKIRVEHGAGASNGYVAKQFYESEPALLELDAKIANLPYFHNQLTGSPVEENIYNAQGSRVKQVSYRYNEDWGGKNSDLLSDSRFGLQWGYRVLSPRDFTYSLTGEGQTNFTIPCWEGFYGPEVFAYTDVPQRHYLESKTERTYGEDGSFTESIAEYDYEDVHFNLIEEKITGTGINWTTKYKYAEEIGSCILDEHMTGIPLEVEAPNGVTYLTEYDCSYLVPKLFQETYQDESSIVRSEVTSFDPKGYPLTIARFGYDTEESYVWKPFPAPDGLLQSKTYLDWTEEFFYNDFRQVRKTIAIDDQPVEYIYDPHGRVKHIKARPGIAGGGHNIVSTITYDMGGPNVVTNQTVYSDAPTQIVRNIFDGLGRPTKTEVNGVTKEENIYDNLGRIRASTYLPGSFTNYSYDGSPLNRLKQEIYPDGNDVQYNYSAEDNEWIVTRINEKDFPTKNYTDILGRQSKMEDAIGGITDYSYDNFGRLTAIAGPAGGYSYGYDDRNRVINKKVPGSLASNFCYDDATDLMCVSTDGNGNRMSMKYDAYQRQTEVFWKEIDEAIDCDCQPSGESVLTYQYDGQGVGEYGTPIYTGKMSYTKAAMLGAGGQVESYYLLDDFGRVELQRDEGNIAGNNFNAKQDHVLNQADWLLSTDHNVAGIANGGGYMHAFTYDGFGRVVAENAGGVFTEMKYNDQDQLLYKIYDGGLDRQDYKYNNRGWLTDINILLPEVLTPEDLEDPREGDEEFCQLPLGEDETYVIQQPVTPVEFFELLCEGQTVVVSGVDECPPPDPVCLEEFNDYNISQYFVGDFVEDTKNEFEYHAHSFYTLSAISGIPLPGYDYCLDGDPGPFFQDPSINTGSHFGVCQQPDPDIGATIADDLRNWLDLNGYSYESVSVSYLRGTIDIHVTKTNYQFTNLTISHYFYGIKKGDKNGGYYSRTRDYDFDPCCTVLEPCSETTFNFDDGDSASGGGGGLAQGGGSGINGTVLPPVDVNTFTFPTGLNEVILADGRKLWLFDFEFQYIDGEYTIGAQLEITSNAQLFEVITAEGSTYIVNLPGLLNFRNSNASIRNISVVAMGPDLGDECPPPPSECDETTQAAQQQSLNEICATTLELFATGAISYPFDVAVVQLCNGEITYVLNSLVDEIDGSHEILNVFPVDEDGLTVQVLVAEPFFAMKFQHEPNGNIWQTKWKVGNRPTSVYDYNYDEIDRVDGSSYWEEYYLEQTITPPSGVPFVQQELVQDMNNRYNTSFSYDGGGNITEISRNGVGFTCGPEGQIDKMTLTYGGESGQQLINVIDEAPDAQLRKAGFRPFPAANHPGSEYQYDDNGNMAFDPHKLMKFNYNFLNLPQTVIKGGTERLKTVYDAAGRKWQVTSTVDVLDINGDATGETYTETKVYLNGIEFIGEGASASRLSSINPSSNGRIAYGFDAETGALGASRVEYYHTDHLGNVRLAFSDLDGDGTITVTDIYDPSNEITQERHYYPFGLTHTGPWYATVSPDNAYRYNGKELDEATGLYDYGARYYDPAIARWGQVDPLADQYAPYSPYNYVLGNPIRLIDPDGQQVEPSITQNEEGQNVVNIKVTGSVIDLSSNYFANPERLARRLGELGKSLSGEMTDVSGLGLTNADGDAITEAIVNFEFDFNAVDKISEIGEADHLIVMADFDGGATGVQLSNGVTSTQGGRLMYVDASSSTGPTDIISGYGTVVAGHEIMSHALNAGHTGNWFKITYGGGVSSYSRGTTQEARRSIVSNAFTPDRLNRGPILSSSYRGTFPVGNVFTRGRAIPVTAAGVNYRSVQEQARQKQ